MGLEGKFEKREEGLSSTITTLAVLKLKAYRPTPALLQGLTVTAVSVSTTTLFVLATERVSTARLTMARFNAADERRQRDWPPW